MITIQRVNAFQRAFEPRQIKNVNYYHCVSPKVTQNKNINGNYLLRTIAKIFAKK